MNTLTNEDEYLFSLGLDPYAEGRFADTEVLQGIDARKQYNKLQEALQNQYEDAVRKGDDVLLQTITKQMQDKGLEPNIRGDMFYELYNSDKQPQTIEDLIDIYGL
ncbi:MAG: hypothetical protein IKT40_01040 [Bacilli bacterium]|nr:hypothetical protein [Bacilli bacterium]